MNQLIRRAQGSTFLRHNLIFFTGSTLVAFVNYLYYPVLGRLMAPSDFGEVQTIISFFMQATVFLQVLALTTIGILKKYDDDDRRRNVIMELEWLALVIGLAVFALLLVFAKPMQHFLQFGSVLPFLLFAVIFLISIPLAFSNSFLQGNKKFGDLARSNLVGASSKLALSVALVLAGLRAVGAIFGLLLSQIINLAYTHWLAVKVGRPPVIFHRHWPRIRIIRPELRFAGIILVTSLAINILLSLDIVTIKHYFSPHEAGLYAGISTIARIIFFLTGPLSAVLIASVRLDDHEHNRALIYRSMALLVLLGGSTAAFFGLFPHFTIQLLLGEKYLTYAHLLPPLSAAVFMLSFANMMVFYQVMLRGAQIATAASLGLMTMVVLLMLHHQSVAAVVTTMLEGSFILSILIVIASNLKPRRGGKPSRIRHSSQ